MTKYARFTCRRGGGAGGDLQHDREDERYEHRPRIGVDNPDSVAPQPLTSRMRRHGEHEKKISRVFTTHSRTDSPRSKTRG